MNLDDFILGITTGAVAFYLLQDRLWYAIKESTERFDLKEKFSELYDKDIIKEEPTFWNSRKILNQIKCEVKENIEQQQPINPNYNIILDYIIENVSE
jgi:hypothetical protein